LNKILIANRGEIAVRIIRACRDLGLRSVAVYAECDRTSLHVRLADEAYAVGGNPAADSYLRIDRLVDVAHRAGADAIHPGYGFLAENERFAAACRDAGLGFVGPAPEAMALVGSKTAARGVAARVGVPVVAGTEPIAEAASDDELRALAGRIGYPLLVKAVAGGGGKGMRRVDDPSGLLASVQTARSEARSGFGDSSVYFERFLERPRHVEVQLLGDHHGNVLPFVERECSIQRRHQKLVEESPSLAVSPALREALMSAAARIARDVGYTSAGTVEFLLDEERPEAFCFLEMNARLQVEHPITEMVTGVDLVAAQMAIARGDPLSLDPQRLMEANGHAIECRVYAEDPEAGFLPSPGRITHLRAPSGPGVRDDSGVTAGSEIPVFYDALISKVAAWGVDREQALGRMARAMAEYEIRGVRTTIPFFRSLLRHVEFRQGRFDTTFVDRWLATPGALAAAFEDDEEVIAAMAVALHALEGPGARPEDDRPGASAPHDPWSARARAEALREWPTSGPRTP